MMSETSAVELVSMRRTSSMAEHPDISGTSLFSRNTSIETQVAPDETQAPSEEPPEKKNPSDETPTEPPEKDCETESETVESDDEEPPAPVEEENMDKYDIAFGAGAVVLFSGMLLAGLSYFLTKPVIMQHPYNSRDFF